VGPVKTAAAISPYFWTGQFERGVAAGATARIVEAAFERQRRTGVAIVALTIAVIEEAAGFHRACVICGN
jgi:hypothetical protein